MPKIVNQRRPLGRINVVLTNDQIGRDVHADDLYFRRPPPAQLLQSLTLHPMHRSDARFHVHRAFPRPRWLHHLTSDRGKSGNCELVLLEAELLDLICGTGSLPVSGASISTFRHRSGAGRFTTHSRWRSMFSAVLVSSSKPSSSVPPSAPKEDIGAKFVVPSSFSELINATGVPK